MTMTNKSDPWESLSPPVQATEVSARRVDHEPQWDLYWALDTSSNCLLILQHAPEYHPKNRLPRLRGLEIEIKVQPAGEPKLLIIRLKDNDQRDIFHLLCLDIIAATRLARSEEDAIERFLTRTWRWHRLLRNGRSDKLSDEEQKGLIGELQLIRQHLFPSIGIEAGIKSWTGPFGTPKDFEVGRVCIESKARRGAARPFVTISTEHQLDTDGIDALFLYVLEVTGTSLSDPKGLTVTEVSRSVLEEIQQCSASVVELFEERLSATGFNWEDDYSQKKWLIGSECLFEVVGKFPRITPRMYPSGTTDVRYSISLQECETYRTDHTRMISLLLGGIHDNKP